MPYKITRFKPEHFDLIEPRKEALPEVEFMRTNDKYKELYSKQMVTNTLWHNDRPILIYGMVNDGLGTYTVLVVAAHDLAKHKFATIKAIYKYYDEYVMNDLRRFEAFVNLDDATALRFAKWFGFAIIGIRHQASFSGHDQAILERLQRKS